MLPRELRFTLRSLWRSKLFTFTSLFVFSFGIAATAIVFSVLDAVVLHPASFIDAQSLVNIQEAHGNGEFDNVSPAVYEAMRQPTNLFTQIAADRNSIFTVTNVSAPDQVFGLTVSANYFSLLDAHPLAGRLFTNADDKSGAPLVTILSYQAWQQLCHGSPETLGSSINIDGQPHTVIGIMPPQFVLPAPRSGSMLWTTLHLSPAEINSPDSRWLELTARVQQGVAFDAIQSAMATLAANVNEPERKKQDVMRLRAAPLAAQSDANSTIFWLAMGMVGGLLLLGCANLSSILLARSVARRKDYAVRLAAGAGRWQLARQTLLEVLALAVASLTIACLLIPPALNLIRSHLTTPGAGIPNLLHVDLNARSLLFAFAVTVCSALLCGIFPALSNASVDLASGLRETGTFRDTRRSSRRFLHSLLALEAALSLLLLLTSGLLLRSLSQMLSEDHGIRADHVLTLHLPQGSWSGTSSNPTPEQRKLRRTQYLSLLSQAQAVPGVEVAALSSSLPLSHVSVRTALRTPGAESKEVLAVSQAVTPDYFRSLGIPILAGSTFPPSPGDHPLALVNQSFVKQYFSGKNPIRLSLSSGEGPGTQIIGVVKDSPNLDLTEKIEPELYLDFEQTTLTPFLTGLTVRTKTEPQAIISSLRKSLALKDAEQPVVQVKTLETLINENVWQPRFAAWFASVFAATAVLLCGVGIYGVVSYVAAARRRDFGIRAALGAERGDLLTLAAIQSLAPVFLGCSLGLLGFYWVSQWIKSLIYKTSPFDPLNTAACVSILLVIALAAVTGPALRAANAHPALTLREE